MVYDDKWAQAHPKVPHPTSIFCEFLQEFI